METHIPILLVQMVLPDKNHLYTRQFLLAWVYHVNNGSGFYRDYR